MLCFISILLSNTSCLPALFCRSAKINNFHALLFGHEVLTLALQHEEVLLVKEQWDLATCSG